MRSWIRFGSSILLLSAAAAPFAGAQTIEDAMSSAYMQNTQLSGQRAQQRATDEQVPQALSNWRPTLQVSGSVSRSHTAYAPPNQVSPPCTTYPNCAPPTSANGFNTDKTFGLQITQNVYRGGRTVAQTNQATNTVKSGQEQLKATEETVLLSAAQSFLDIVRDQSEVDLNANNEAVLKRELDAERDRFRVGEVDRTDVALAEAAYEQARAQHTSAIGTLETDRANYQRVIGQAPGRLTQPKFTYQLPGSLEDAIAESESNNPNVTSAEFTERAARDAIDLAEGARLPTVQIVGTLSRDYPGANSVLDAGKKRVDTGSVAAQMTWPLYTGGQASSQVRQAKQTANQYLIAIEDAKRVARQNAISVWNQLVASRANIEALTAQVKAAEIGAEGTREKVLVGTATVLDSLTAEQNLLSAEVNLAVAQHDALFYSYSLLSAVGRMNARDLTLPVEIYDPQVNQNRVADKWFGAGIE
jgi:TolC family type I secretion outer membrane protein